MTGTPLQQAIATAGSQAALARGISKHLGREIKGQHVWRWLNGSGRIPPIYVIPCEVFTGISRYHLRPDIYPPEEGQAAA